MSKKSKRTGRGGLLALIPMVAVGLAAILGTGWLDSHGWGTLAARAGERQGSLRMSEVQNNNLMTLPEREGISWIELENAGDTPVSLRGLCLTRDGKLNKTLVFPDATIEPGGFLLVWADETLEAFQDADGAMHAPFRLPRSGSHALYLYDEAANLIDSATVPDMKTDESYCRNAEGAWEVTVRPSPGAANTVIGQIGERMTPGDVAINEVMTSNVAAFPDEAGEVWDYVELVNLSAQPVSLEGYRLSDDQQKPDKWRFPAVTIPAGGLLAVHCSGLDRKDDPTHLHAGFKLSGGETVFLFNAQGDLTSMVALPDPVKGWPLSRGEDGEWTTALPPTPNLPNNIDAVLALDGQRQAERAGGVFISELMALPGGETGDWVELCNAGESDVDLSDWGFSNNLKKARKWQFPAGTHIPAHGRLALAMLGSDDKPLASGAPFDKLVSVPFALNGEGGYALTLCRPDGALADCLYVPEQYPGISFGRADSGECGYFEAPTPMKDNGSSVILGRPAAPVYSVPGGLHEKGEEFSVTMTAESGARIYYTLDCSDPSDRSTLYDGTPIPIRKNTILRTRVYREGHMPSAMDTQSYLFDVHGASEVPYVISLVSDPKNLASSRTGIMVSGKHDNLHQEWEREAHVEVFLEGGEPVIAQECGIKLHGRNTRNYQLKSFKLMAKRKYGKEMFSYPLFRDRPYDEYEAFILRYSGQDYKYTFMRDVVMTRQAKHTSVMYMESMECIVYLNGKYYSAMYIRENISPFSLARREGWAGQEDEIDLVKSDNEVKQGSDADYLALNDFLNHHDANTQEVYDRIDAEVDIDNFIEYCGLYVVYCPPDTVNVKRYRNHAADNKWRWVLYDLDRGLRNLDGDGFKLMATGTNGALFRAVMKNDALRDRFLRNLNTALATYLSSQSLHDEVIAQVPRISPILPDYLKNVKVTQASYKAHLQGLLGVIDQRPARVIKQCASYMHLTDAEVRAYFPDALAAIEAYKNQ